MSAAGPRVSADKGALWSTLRNLWPDIWPAGRPDLKRAVLLALACLVVSKVLNVLVPFVFKWLTDTLVGEGETRLALTGVEPLLAVPLMLAAAYGATRILSNAFMQLRDALFAAVAMHAVKALSDRTFEHLHRLSLRFHLSRRTGGLSRVIERGSKGIETIVRLAVLMGLPTIVEFVLMAAVVAWEFDWTYLVVIALTVCLYMWFSITASNWRISIRRDMNEADTDSMSKAVDSLLNYETVKYFNNETMERERFGRATRRYEQAAIKSYTSLAWLNIGQVVIFTLGMTVCMGLSAVAIMEGRQTIGQLVMINALLMQLAMPLNFIGMLYREMKQGIADVEAMFAVLDVPAEVTDKPGAPALRVTEGVVRFENVVFRYDPDRTILRGISLEVPAGRTVAIVGPSGAGKSTISRLLFRFYDASEGRILVDDQDIRDVRQESLRRIIGMVPQDTVLFNDTIAYNIRYGRPDATDEEVREAARLAQIDGFIESLPQGYDTEVGERGLKLSGGEKQRVAIARTILKAPKILMLDEATSALDIHTEREIQAALEMVSRNRTTLVIAHRLATVVGADEIVVLEAGRIVERGTHAELLAAAGLYASMWERQKAADDAIERLQESLDNDPHGVVIRGPTAEARVAAE